MEIVIDAGTGLLFFGGIVIGTIMGILGSESVTLKYMIIDTKRSHNVDDDQESFIESLESDYKNANLRLYLVLGMAIALFIIMMLFIEFA
ncbi:hypothetical protein [Methanolobus profundi]|uniref:Uncharacterized protein n=1 Tax=Methanolobus profundi TaxID=487685 RepID=A0A1I4TSU6_9EURY|nr:hypothetical protein [Methanolobus profundi]SFM79779.1 hypothetical protein SAMN04488696_2439 [Methanolobus profundi]